jgi:hypothetical protein
MEQLDLIEEVTRNDGSRYSEISNIGLIKKVKILQLNIPRTKALIAYEKYINDTYDLQTLTNESDWKNPKWVEWDKPKGKILDAYNMILKANRIG